MRATPNIVTIVGNQAGIDEASEQLLRNSGCKVERIAGRNEDETGRMLAELARFGPSVPFV